MISVIIPVHNTERYIDRCVQSVLANTYKDIEIILVENGSTDRSLEICRKYEKDYANIKVIVADRTGLSHARNLGMDVAQGEYIAFLDSDDFVSPYLYETLRVCAVKKCIDFVFCDFFMGEKEDFEWTSPDDLAVRDMTLPEFYYDTYMQSQYIYSMAWNKLFHKNLVSDIRFDEELLYYEDRAFVVKCAARSERIIYLNEKLIYYYRANMNAISKQEDQSKRIYQIHSLVKERTFMERTFPENACYAERVNAALLQNGAYRIKKAKEAERTDLVELLTPIVKVAAKRLLKAKEIAIGKKARYLLEYKMPVIFRLAYRIKRILKK